MRKTAPFELYIRRALGDPDAEIFQRSSHIRTPTLVAGHTHRVILYRGSFNPPHQGHKDALCHAFFRSGSDLNIVAAMIVTLPDTAVAYKYRKIANNDVPAYVLTEAQRKRLWNASGLHGGWHFFFPNPIDQSQQFTEDVRYEAGREGFDVRFITLLGPDYVNVQGTNSGEVLVAGTGNDDRVNFRGEHPSGFRSVKEYGPWTMLKLDKGLIRQLGTEGSPQWLEQKLQMLVPDQVKGLPEDPVKRRKALEFRLQRNLRRLGPVRVCQHLTGPPHQWLRFVPTRFIGMTSGANFLGDKVEGISSTRIRRTIANQTSREAFIEALGGMALSPELLYEYIIEARAVEKREKEAQILREKREEKVLRKRKRQEKQHERPAQNVKRKKDDVKFQS
ncbi:hypothetical protein BDV95DRAFT_599642 [Massariosphaeria phaeospora]|uniref:Cytidyltransferase-like domain-containing protein n=1 Tax=Massariosphaeria phaeospora TaxID=100035 RepID=A0A7C8M089_9PLEO|nr:hypothetical protein BDV95DRAFT_599642 [Massariosphaeria phaeospora]